MERLMRHWRALALSAAVVIVAAACAPSFSSIYDSDSTITTMTGGAHTQNEVWSIGTTTHSTRDYKTNSAVWNVDCSVKDNYGFRVNGGPTTGDLPDNGAYGGWVKATQPANTVAWETNSTGSDPVNATFTGGSRTSFVVTLTGVSGATTYNVGDFVDVTATDTTYNLTSAKITAKTATTLTYTQLAANDAASGSGTLSRRTYGYHYCPGIKSEARGFVYDRWHISGMGDGFVDRDNGTIGDATRFSRSWVTDSGDDCVQSDSGAKDVSIEGVFCDAAWAGISARQSTGDFSGSTMDVTNSIIYVADKPIPACYHYLAADGGKACGTGGASVSGGHAGWLKWFGTEAQATKAILRDTVWIAGSYPRNSGDLAENAPLDTSVDISGTPENDACNNNTLILLTPTGDANYASDLANFNNDVATWASRGCTNTHAYTMGDTGADNAYARTLNVIGGWHQSYDGLIQSPGTR
jgi:hypothetical protein